MKARLTTMTVLAATVIAAAGMAHAQNTDQCLRMVVSATGDSAMWNHQAEAEKNAVSAWTAQAAKQAGAAYSQWGKAKAKNIACEPVSKSTIRCTAKAMPCK
jgi:hypothetical protein